MLLRRKRQQHKTRFIALAAVTLDGRISLDSAEMPSFTSPEDWKFFQSELKKMEAVVGGSTTFEAAKEHMSKRIAYVLTSSVQEPRVEGSVTFVNPDHTDLRALLSNHASVGIVGGADAYRTMLDLGLCDELYLTIEPVAFGRGRELFSELKNPAKFRLKFVKKLNTQGTIVLRYEVLH